MNDLLSAIVSESLAKGLFGDLFNPRGFFLSDLENVRLIKALKIYLFYTQSLLQIEVIFPNKLINPLDGEISEL